MRTNILIRHWGQRKEATPLGEPASSKIRHNYEWDVYFMCQDSLEPIRVSKAPICPISQFVSSFLLTWVLGPLCFAHKHLAQRRIVYVCRYHSNYRWIQPSSCLVAWTCFNSLKSPVRKQDTKIWPLEVNKKDMRLCDNNSVPVIAPVGELSWDMRIHQV